MLSVDHSVPAVLETTEDTGWEAEEDMTGVDCTSVLSVEATVEGSVARVDEITGGAVTEDSVGMVVSSVCDSVGWVVCSVCVSGVLLVTSVCSVTSSVTIGRTVVSAVSVSTSCVVSVVAVLCVVLTDTVVGFVRSVVFLEVLTTDVCVVIVVVVVVLPGVTGGADGRCRYMPRLTNPMHAAAAVAITMARFRIGFCCMSSCGRDSISRSASNSPMISSK